MHGSAWRNVSIVGNEVVTVLGFIKERKIHRFRDIDDGTNGENL
jgi:hypothetical protein